MQLNKEKLKPANIFSTDPPPLSEFVAGAWDVAACTVPCTVRALGVHCDL